MEDHTPQDTFLEGYKTYTCATCSYSADVFGSKIWSFEGIYETHVCLNCMILIEVCIGWDTVDFETEIPMLISETPTCLSCNKQDTIPWDSNLCKCPKCNSTMHITRLDFLDKPPFPNR